MRWIRVLLVLLLALLALLQWRLWTGEGGRSSVMVLEQRVQAQARENDRLQQRNAALAAEVEDLKSGEAAVDERARSELGMIKPGETFYRVVEARTGGAIDAPGADPESGTGARIDTQPQSDPDTQTDAGDQEP